MVKRTKVRVFKTPKNCCNTYNMCLLSNTSIVDVHIYGMFHSTFSTCFRSVCTCMYMYMCVYVQNVSSVLQWSPLFRIPRNEDALINWMRFVFPNTVCVYITTPEIETPR